MSPAADPTCVLADDHPVILDSVSRYLEANGLRIVGTARNGEEAVALIEAERPALAVLDARMPRLSGAEVTRSVARTVPDCAALIFSGFADHSLLLEALDAGARGFVVKDAPLDNLLRALETVRSGAVYIDPGLAGAVIRWTPERDLGLTARERDLLRLLADGHSNESIGHKLFMSPDTARAQLRVAMRKLSASTRTQAVATALRKTLIA
jgi:DNA-binding NarL/FixJ family response regulator